MTDFFDARAAARMPTHVPMVLFGAVAALAIGSYLLDFRFTWSNFAAIGGISTLLLVAHLHYARRPGEERVAALLGVLFVAMTASATNAYLAYVALAAGSPMIDTQLAAATALVGFDHAAFVTALAGHPWLVRLLDLAYMTTLPILLATVIALAVSGRLARLWRVAALHTHLLTLCVALSAIVPARGPFLVEPLPAAVRAALPPGAGDFYREIFEAIRDGRLRSFDMGATEGVVVFPSFHTVMALLIVHGLWAFRPLRGVAAVYAGLVLVSTIPIGGHYLADVVFAAAMVAVGLAIPARSTWFAGPAPDAIARAAEVSAAVDRTGRRAA